MAQATPDSVRQRARWTQQWLRAAAGDQAERSALLDSYATLHASSQRPAPSDPGRPVELRDLLDLEGQRALALTARIVARILPDAGPFGSVVPVLAAVGEAPLRAERSRPDWHLNGVARSVGWSPDVECLAVFAVDEGDNDVLALVAPDAARVEITQQAATGSGRVRADLRFDDVALPTVAPCPGTPAQLADGLTVLSMADVIDTVSGLLDRPGDHAELQLCRAALSTAAASLTSASVVRRQHDVSAAALLVLPTCLRLAAGARSQDDPGVAGRVQCIREQVLDLPAWHRQRLVALV